MRGSVWPASVVGSIRNRWTTKTAESNGKYHSKRDTYILNLHATQLNLQQNCSRCSYRRIDVDVEVVVGDEDERRRQWSSSIRCRKWRWTWPTILSHEVSHERWTLLRTVAPVMSFSEGTVFQVKIFLQCNVSNHITQLQYVCMINCKAVA